jgi:hypothetical protein
LKHVAILFAVTLCVHVPFLRAGYTTDDFEHIGRVISVPFTEVITRPDTIGFFRPVQHATYWIETRVAPSDRGALARVNNLALHLAVIGIFFAVARRILPSPLGAFAAALAFVLAPKSSTIAIMWISARSETLATGFVLLAILSWIRWVERGRTMTLALAGLCYLLACLSKEAVLLMPFLLLVLPPGLRRSRRHLVAIAMFAALGAGVLAARAAAGALTPWAPSPYNLMTSWTVWADNARNYAARAVPAPALIVAASLVAGGAARIGLRPLLPILVVAVTWFAVFIVPVLPIAARSEIRLYLPQLGLCLLAGAVVQAIEAHAGTRRSRLLGALAVCAVSLGGYQMARAAAAAENLEFSESFITAVRQHPALQDHRGLVLLTPASPEVDQKLRDSIGSYIRPILRQTFGRNDIDGTMVDRRDPAAPVTLRLLCEEQPGGVRLLAK